MILSPDTLSRLTSSRYLGPLTLALAVPGLAVNEIGYQSLERLSDRTRSSWKRARSRTRCG